MALRLYQLQSVPLWTDEMFTLYYPRAGLDYLWGAGLPAEATSPLYYTLIDLAEKVAGPQVWAIRLPSVLGSLLSVWLAWLLARELFPSRLAAALGALLLALAPINVFFAQEARSYALQGAAIGLALLGFAKILRGGPGFIMFTAGAALAVWMHPTSVAAIAGIDAVALGAFALRAMPARQVLRGIGANVAVAVLCLPLIPSIVAPPNEGAATGWIPALNRWTLESVIGQTLAGPAFDQSQRIAEFGVLLLALLALVPLWRPGWRALLVVVLAPAVAFALMIGVSVFKPILLTRTLAWLLLPLAVALGGILSRRNWVLIAACVAAVGAGSVWQAVRAPSLKENWPALFAQMGQPVPSEMVVLAPHSPPGALPLYAPSLPAPVRLDDGGPPIPETSVIPRLMGTPTISLDALSAAIDSGRPVWLIYRRPEYEGIQRVIAGLPPPDRSVQSEPGSNPALRALFWHIKQDR